MAKTIFATIRLIVDEDADPEDVISDYEFRHDSILDTEIEDVFEDELVNTKDDDDMSGYVGMDWSN